jgi:PAS domain S-box-containing protein
MKINHRAAEEPRECRDLLHARRQADAGPLPLPPQGANAAAGTSAVPIASHETAAGHEASRDTASQQPAAALTSYLRYQELFDFAPDGYVVTDADGIILEANYAAAALLQTRREFLVNKPLAMYVAHGARAAFYMRLVKMRPGGAVEQCEMPFGRGQEEPRHVLLAAVAVAGADGRAAGFRWLLRDITSRMRMEQRLREEKDFVDSLLNTVPAAVLVIDSAGRIVRSNPYLHAACGKSSAEVQGQDWCDLFLPESDRLAGREMVWRALANSVTRTGALPFMGQDARREFVWSAKLLSENDDGGRLVLLGEDVTELQTAQLRVSSILDHAADGILTLNESGTVDSCNHKAEQLFGYASGAIVGRSLGHLLPSRSAAVRSEEGETYGQRADGSMFPLQFNISEVREHSSRWFTVIIHDLSRRRNLEKEILEVAAAEQRRIGEDLHDEVGQELTGLSLLADNLVESFPDKSGAEARTMSKVRDGLKRTLRLVRELSQGLIPVEVDPEGLMSALEDLAARTSTLLGITCTFRCKHPVPVEDNAIATHLYRITKEAIANALRHGKAKNIHVTLTRAKQVGNLRIQDDGVGLQKPESEKPASGGMGLKIMHHRAELINGKITIRRGPRGGTIVTCSFPAGSK